jgi:hypothetical protein
MGVDKLPDDRGAALTCGADAEGVVNDAFEVTPRCIGVYSVVSEGWGTTFKESSIGYFTRVI